MGNCQSGVDGFGVFRAFLRLIAAESPNIKLLVSPLDFELTPSITMVSILIKENEK